MSWAVYVRITKTGGRCAVDYAFAQRGVLFYEVSFPQFDLTFAGNSRLNP